uniref:Peptidase M41 domain-containing protein n=1 Tax=Zea mays TaxID=4577 RepID=A0A804QZX9_MAIZE
MTDGESRLSCLSLATSSATPSAHKQYYQSAFLFNLFEADIPLDADARTRRGAQKVTLIPRGAGADPTLVSKQQIFARIVGGRAAEEVILGEPEVTTGAAGDLQQVTLVER